MCTLGLRNTEMITKPPTYKLSSPFFWHDWLFLQDLAVQALGLPICTVCHWRGSLSLPLMWEYLSKLRAKTEGRFTGIVSGLTVLNSSCEYHRSPRDSAAPLRQGWEPLPPISRLRAGEDSEGTGWDFTRYVAMTNGASDRTVPSWRWPHVDPLFCRAAQNNLHLPNSVGKNQQLYALVPGWAV